MTSDPGRVADAELVAAVRAGEHRAFGELLRRHERSVLRLTRRLLSSNIDAEDVAQEAFVHAFMGIDRLRKPEAFGGWVHAIAANLARKELRASRHSAVDGAPEQWVGDGFDALEQRDALAAALAELPLSQREVVVGYLAGFSYAEIARHSCVPLSTVRGRMFQGRLRLRAALATASSTTGKDALDMQPIPVTPAVYGTFRRSSDRVLVLAEADGARELGIRLSAADAAALEAALAGRELPDDAAGNGLALRILRALEARVERATVHDIPGSDDSGYYATLTLKGRIGQCVVVAGVAAALSLVVAEGAPVVVPTDVLARRGWDPSDMSARRRLDRTAARRLREIIESGSAPAAVPPPLLSSGTSRALDAALERLVELPGVRTVVVTHENGALQGWRGEGDAETLELYAALWDGEEDELAQLVTDAAFPSEHVFGGVRFETVAAAWRLHIALTEEGPPHRWEKLEQELAAVRDELEPLLASDEVERTRRSRSDRS